ncbi:hypothetical protein [Alkalilimnicola ehrlichii]|uniref:hypothetical protein n=1 Tax=Alkalilimnicola ehrlichii TaxID=351052 RepID=UPI0021618092|nr:hypothetical protein [Alkalilimnicola ehrlichii]
MLLEIHRGDAHLISGQLVYVTANPEQRQSVPMPASLRQAILDYEKISPSVA